MYEFRLYLYISGETSNSVASTWNLKSLLQEKLKGRYSLEVINVLDNPERAQEDNILATPTLVKASPPPERRVVGDLSDKETVLLALGLAPQEDKVSK
jgi:circadian clock protein KaiB